MKRFETEELRKVFDSGDQSILARRGIYWSQDATKALPLDVPSRLLPDDGMVFFEGRRRSARSSP